MTLNYEKYQYMVVSPKRTVVRHTLYTHTKGLVITTGLFLFETYEVHIRNTSSQIARRYYDASEYVFEDKG
ncbi:MAG: hypothetical protein CM15mP83_6600 [Flavobacteriaceae bacterium]|nr:MAG: hypothetical protein CM15mP83_6600 [Flavobacteriaceae bacterium]